MISREQAIAMAREARMHNPGGGFFAVSSPEQITILANLAYQQAIEDAAEKLEGFDQPWLTKEAASAAIRALGETK